jgi:hypothetical protein
MVIYNKYSVLSTLDEFKEFSTKTPFEYMYKLKKKGKKSYKLNPKPYCSDVTISKGYMLVWTDGSAKDATFKQYKEFKRPAKKQLLASITTRTPHLTERKDASMLPIA